MSKELMTLPKPLPLQPEEQELIRPKKRRSVSEWAEQERILSKKTSNYYGKWSNDLVPFAVEIMDCLSDAYTREVWVQKCGQSSGTEIGLNFLGHTIEEEPGPMMIVMPTENDVKKRFRTRIRPMFESNPALRKHLPTGRLDNLNIGQETELDNMFLYLAWAGSPSAMADTPIQKLVLDEGAKYPAFVKEEAGSIDLLRDRATTYPDSSKLYAPSTPILVNDVFDLEFQNTDQRKYWIQCVFCGQFHISRRKYIELDKDSAGNLLSPRDYRSGKCARYVCPECGKKWDEAKRWQAVCSGRWAPRDCKVDSSGRITGKVFSNPNRGYHISALMLYPGFRTIASLAEEWAKVKRAQKAGNIKPLQNYINSRLGEPWEEKEKQTEKNVLQLHIGTYEPDIVPRGVQMLTAGIDIQIDHIWVMLLGWGYMSEVWSLFEARLETGDTKDLENYKLLRMFLSKSWPLAEGKQITMHIIKAAIDCNYRPDTVKDFCQQCTEADLIPVRGDDTVRTKMFRSVRIEGTNMYRYDLNVNAFKDRLFRLLYESKVAGAGYFHLHKDTSDESLEQLCSEEQRLIRGRRRTEKIWVLKTEHSMNHLWDCCVYAAAAAELAGVRMLKSLDEIEKEKKPKKPKRKKDGFLDDLPELY